MLPENRTFLKRHQSEIFKISLCVQKGSFIQNEARRTYFFFTILYIDFHQRQQIN